MLVVKVELHHAVTGKITEIGRAQIFNEGGGASDRVADYGVRIFRRKTKDRVQRTAEVKNHARKSLPVWVLVRKALEAAGF